MPTAYECWNARAESLKKVIALRRVTVLLAYTTRLVPGRTAMWRADFNGFRTCKSYSG